MQGLIGLLVLLGFAVFSAVLVTLSSPRNRRKLAAWLIASALAQEEIRRAREEVKARETKRRARLIQAMAEEGGEVHRALRFFDQI